MKKQKNINNNPQMQRRNEHTSFLWLGIIAAFCLCHGTIYSQALTNCTTALQEAGITGKGIATVSFPLWRNETIPQKCFFKEFSDSGKERFCNPIKKAGGWMFFDGQEGPNVSNIDGVKLATNTALMLRLLQAGVYLPNSGNISIVDCVRKEPTDSAVIFNCRSYRVSTSHASELFQQNRESVVNMTLDEAIRKEEISEWERGTIQRVSSGKMSLVDIFALGLIRCIRAFRKKTDTAETTSIEWLRGALTGTIQLQNKSVEGNSTQKCTCAA